MMLDLRDAKKHFLDYVAAYASYDTYKFYENCINIFIDYIDLPFPEINNLNNNTVTDFIKYLRYHSKVKNVTVRSYIRGLKVFDNYLYENGFKLEPLSNLKLPKDDRDLKIPLSDQEVKVLVAAIERMPESLIDRNLCIFYLMLDCGLRLQEVCNLKVTDVNFIDKLIYVRNSKNNKSRVVPLPEDLAVLLASYFGSREFQSPYMFLMNSGDVITKTAVKNMFRKLKNVVPRVHAHLLRHTFATSYIMGGGSLEVLRVLLGHSTYNVTQFYKYNNAI